MTKILFVCHGNICRSPMAELIMKDLITKNGLENDFYIESAATSNEEEGNPIYPPTRRILEKRGIDCGGKFARKMTASDYNKFDLIVCMDSNNIINLNRIAKDVKNKYSKLLDYTDNPHDVADPWYTGDFAKTEKDIDNGCQALLNYILKKEQVL